MSKRAIALLVLVAACSAACSSGCSSLDEIETGVCGNGAIEVREDCDSTNTDECVACQLRCQGTDPTCPAGYACGADGICRAPSGVFYPTPPTTFATTDFAVSDVDWDGAGDVLGLTATSINVLQGDATPVEPGQATSLFATQYSMLTPFGRGDPVFGDFDDDSRRDVLLPTADGLAGFSSAYRTLAPHAFAFSPGGAGNMMDGFVPSVVFSFHPDHVAFLFGNPATPGQPGLMLALLDVNSGDTGPNLDFVRPVCSTIDPTDNLTYDSYIVNAAPLQALVAVRDQANHVCVFRVTVPGPGTDPFTATPLNEAMIPNSTRPVFADLDGAGCPSLVVAVGKEVRAAATSPCALSGTLSNLPMEITTRAIGRVPIQTPLGNVGPDALITSFGVYAITTTRTIAIPIYASDRPLDSSAFGDIDADGKIDAVVASDASNGVDVLFSTGTSVLLYRIATAGFVTQLAVGDYDGNGVDDVVFTERLDDERLLVAYGTRDRPLAPVENGRFTNITAFVPVQIADSIDRQRIVLDLAVVDEPADNQMLLTVLHGSPQRTLVSYFDPRNGGGGNFDPGAGFYAAIAGQFSTKMPSPEATDVIAIEWSRVRSATRLYLNIGVGGGALDQSFEPPTMPMSDPTAFWFNLDGFAQGDKCSGATFCLDHARFLALRRSPLDRVIGIDRAATPTAIMLDVGSLAPTTDPLATLPTNVPASVGGFEPGAGFSLVSLRAADVDGDGVEDAIAAFVAGDAGEVRVCLKDDFETCPSLTTLANVPDLVCGDVAPARAQARGRFDAAVEAMPAEPMPLVALCAATGGSERSVYRFVKVGATYSAAKLFGVGPTAARLEIGDVNGDGLDDILVLDSGGGVVAPQLQAFLQCRSSDVTCRTTFAPGGAVVAE